MPAQPAVQGPKGPPAPTSGTGRRPPWLWVGLGGLVVAIAIFAIVVSGGGDKDKKEDTEKAASAGLKQTQPVKVTGTALPELGDGGADEAVGMTAPELRGKGFDGKSVTVTHDGRPKLLMFLAHWCPHCQREVPLVVGYLKDNPLPEQVDLVAVATSTDSNQNNYPPSEWLAREDWPSPVMADSAAGTAAQAYGLSSFPYFVALDSSGKVVGRSTGEITTDQFAQLVTAATTGQATKG